MKTHWYKFASSKDELERLLGKKECVPLRINATAVLLVKHKNEFHLVKNRCPHQGKTMEHATCKEGKIICPWHQYAFSLENGRGSGLYLELYPIEKREDGFYAGFERFSLF